MKGKESKGKERKGKESKAKQRKGKERKGKESKGKQSKAKERKAKGTHTQAISWRNSEGNERVWVPFPFWVELICIFPPNLLITMDKVMRKGQRSTFGNFHPQNFRLLLNNSECAIGNYRPKSL